ncbi:MAG: catalase family protein [Rhizobacter sp.]|nr:catalase family protein [Bacteriovorax sp.]
MTFINNKFFLATFLMVTALACTNDTKKNPDNRIPASTVTVVQPKTELNESWTQDDVNNSNGILSIIEETLDKSTNGDPVMKRDAHPKHHGCVQASVEMDASALSNDQQVGVFSKTAPKKYEAWIRFSNGNPNFKKADADGDVRGMAIKLMNVTGSTSGSQDFLLMNSKSFFIKDSKEYVDFMKATEGNLSLLWFLATHGRTRNVILAAQGMKVGNPLHVDYFSATPYKLGNKVVKYSARSCTPSDKRDSIPKNPSHNFLHERLANTLKESEACFDFYAQVSVDARKMPVEDPTVEWDESLSPYKKIGRITIPKQTGVDTAEQMKFCENLSFDPWHTLPEQRPLGAINRVRLQVYTAISKKRHDYNSVPQIEPKSLSACTGDTEVLCK